VPVLLCCDGCESQARRDEAKTIEKAKALRAQSKAAAKQ
jgi:hypothetical protein